MTDLPIKDLQAMRQQYVDQREDVKKAAELEERDLTDTDVKEMEDLAPTREKWYQEFFDRITNIGFNTDGDDKMKIDPADLPVKPEGRKDKVTWKYGVDGE